MLLDRKCAELEEASVQPSPAEPPVTNKGTKRRSGGPTDLVEINAQPKWSTLRSRSREHWLRDYSGAALMASALL